jgi:lysozyme family protein
MSFERAFEILLIDEGEQSNHTADKGGFTKYGISSRAYPKVDIINLTQEQAKDIYRRDYWDKLHLDEIVHGPLQMKVFNTAVNVGQRTACKWLQHSVNFGYRDPHKLVVDGMIGLKTIGAVNNLAGNLVVSAVDFYRGLQAAHYLQIVRSSKSQQVFLNGWLKRAYS